MTIQPLDILIMNPYCAFHHFFGQFLEQSESFRLVRPLNRLLNERLNGRADLIHTIFPLHIIQFINDSPAQPICFFLFSVNAEQAGLQNREERAAHS